MYLSEWNTVADATEWMSQITGKKWSWRNVLELYRQTNPETVAVALRLGTTLTRLAPGEIQDVTFTYPRMMKVSGVVDFLSHISMGDDAASALALPLALVDGEARYRPCMPIPLSSIRLHREEMLALSALHSHHGWKNLQRSLREGNEPELEALLAQHAESKKSPESNNEAAKQRVSSSPQGGDSLTPLLWEVLHDLRAEGKPITPRFVMAILKKLAGSELKQHPLVGTVAGGVKYEYEQGEEKELTSSMLAGRIKTWKAMQSDL